MNCNCKKNSSLESTVFEENINQKKPNNVLSYVLKIFTFIIFLCVSPLVFLGIIILTFKMLVLNSSIDLKPLFDIIAKKLIVKNNDYQEDGLNIDDLTEDDLVMTNVEDITNKKF